MAEVVLDELVQTQDANKVGHPLHPQVLLAVLLHGQEGERPIVLEREQLLDERLLLDVRLDREFEIAA